MTSFADPMNSKKSFAISENMGLSEKTHHSIHVANAWSGIDISGFMYWWNLSLSADGYIVQLRQFLLFDGRLSGLTCRLRI